MPPPPIEVELTLAMVKHRRQCVLWAMMHLPGLEIPLDDNEYNKTKNSLNETIEGYYEVYFKFQYLTRPDDQMSQDWLSFKSESSAWKIILTLWELSIEDHPFEFGAPLDVKDGAAACVEYTEYREERLDRDRVVQHNADGMDVDTVSQTTAAEPACIMVPEHQEPEQRKPESTVRPHSTEMAKSIRSTSTTAVEEATQSMTDPQPSPPTLTVAPPQKRNDRNAGGLENDARLKQRSKESTADIVSDEVEVEPKLSDDNINNSAGVDTAQGIANSEEVIEIKTTWEDVSAKGTNWETISTNSPSILIRLPGKNVHISSETYKKTCPGPSKYYGENWTKPRRVKQHGGSRKGRSARRSMQLLKIFNDQPRDGRVVVFQLDPFEIMIWDAKKIIGTKGRIINTAVDIAGDGLIELSMRPGTGDSWCTDYVLALELSEKGKSTLGIDSRDHKVISAIQKTSWMMLCYMRDCIAMLAKGKVNYPHLDKSFKESATVWDAIEEQPNDRATIQIQKTVYREAMDLFTKIRRNKFVQDDKNNALKETKQFLVDDLKNDTGGYEQTLARPKDHYDDLVEANPELWTREEFIASSLLGNGINDRYLHDGFVRSAPLEGMKTKRPGLGEPIGESMATAEPATAGSSRFKRRRLN
ncbi:hypothetical protein F4808DRAFT_460440 [Astrocystis sublimbata]|nr:hypothetical protein F4808DRAFT_460440 [Astrocystis sublimbata]